MICEGISPESDDDEEEEDAKRSQDYPHAWLHRENIEQGGYFLEKFFHES